MALEDWQAGHRFGLLVVWPPEDVRRQVNALRERFDPRSHGYSEAHITIAPPLLVECVGEVRTTIAEVVKGHRRFSLSYGPATSFPNSPCIYLQVSPVRQLALLRAELLATKLFREPE